jgi:hypothetical protein
MRASGKTGMTDEQIADFVNRFMPAYRAYLPRLYQKVKHCCFAESRAECNSLLLVPEATLLHKCCSYTVAFMLA